MALIRWEPFREVESLQKEMNRLLDRIVPTDVGNGEKVGLSFIPAAEMTETPEAVQLKLEIPGMEAKDLNLEVTADSLTINGERKSEIKTEEEGFTRLNSVMVNSIGLFLYRFRLITLTWLLNTKMAFSISPSRKRKKKKIKW